MEEADKNHDPSNIASFDIQNRTETMILIGAWEHAAGWEAITLNFQVG